MAFRLKTMDGSGLPYMNRQHRMVHYSTNRRRRKRQSGVDFWDRVIVWVRIRQNQPILARIVKLETRIIYERANRQAPEGANGPQALARKVRSPTSMLRRGRGHIPSWFGSKPVALLTRANTQTARPETPS